MSTTHSVAFLKRRKFLMVMPLLILPFMTMAFWSLGGGSGPVKESVKTVKGINTVLPDADFKNKSVSADKMSLYDQMQRDSAKLLRQEGYGSSLSAYDQLGKPDPSEVAIESRLKQINSQLGSAPAPVAGKPFAGKHTIPPAPIDLSMSADVDRLEKLMKNMQAGGEDPEMAQLSEMMDKIIDIQNPGLGKPHPLKGMPIVPDSLFKAIPAEIAGTLKAVQGSVIELRLLDTVMLGGQLIPKGHSVFGLANFSNQRIALEIKNIRLGNQIIPVSLSVFDKRDGMIGLNAPEALFSDALNSGADDAIRGMHLFSTDQSIGTQVAGAGLEAAKGLFSKKVKRVKQKLVAGYPVLLRDNSIKGNK